MKIKLNGVELFYQKLGQGPSLLLLHGHHNDGAVFDKLIAPLSLYYTVYVPDMRGHGLSSGEVSEHYQTEVADVCALIKALKLDHPFVLGFGSGGLVALSIAGQYPGIFKRLIVAGTYVNGSGVSSRHLTWNSLHGFLFGDRESQVAVRETNLAPELLHQITTPTLCVVGEKDWVKIEHVRWYASRIPNCRLVIMPRQTHDSYVVHSLKLLDLIKDFCQTN